MPLREYQKDVIERVRQAYRSGRRAPCIVLPCGGGKSVIAAEIAKKATQKGNRVLFIVHRKELCDQIDRTFRDWGVNMTLCRVGMVQTISRRIANLQPPALIITDENHHSKAASYKKIYEAFPDARRIGITATPIRLDGSGLGDVNDELIIGAETKWLIRHHFLAPYDYYAPSMVDLTGVRTVRGEFDSRTAENAMLKKAIFGDVISHYRTLADGKQAICYCTTIRHSQAMEQAFNRAGINARHLDGNTPKNERDTIIERFRSGQIDVLCNADLISEGFDVPDCECAILLRPTKSLTLYIQQSMRCMRYRPGKRAVIIDHVGNYARFGLPDEHRDWQLHAKKTVRKNTEEHDVPVRTCPECFKVFRTVDETGKRVTACPFCGFVFSENRNTTLEEKQAVLERISHFVVTYDSPDDCANYTELLLYARSKGYMPGWAYYQAKRRGMLSPRNTNS